MLQPTFATTILKTAPEIDEKSDAVRELSVAETEAELGGFYLWEYNHAAARSQVEQALQDDPKLGLAHELMRFLNFSDAIHAPAHKHFAQAFALDRTLYL